MHSALLSSSGGSAVSVMNSRGEQLRPVSFPSHPHGWFGFGRLPSRLYYVILYVKIKGAGLEKQIALAFNRAVRTRPRSPRVRSSR